MQLGIGELRSQSLSLRNINGELRFSRTECGRGRFTGLRGQEFLLEQFLGAAKITLGLIDLGLILEDLRIHLGQLPFDEPVIQPEQQITCRHGGPLGDLNQDHLAVHARPDGNRGDGLNRANGVNGQR